MEFENKESDHPLKDFGKSSEDEEQQNNKQIKKKTVLNLSKRGYNIVKTCLFVIAIICLFMGKAFGVPDESYNEIGDPVMYDWLSPMNQKVNENKTLAKVLQISSSLLMDMSFFVMFGYWVLKINTGRLLYSVAAFYVFRNIVQRFVIFPFPQGYFWDDPGFPSLTIPYGHSSDFFWSGHCGFLTVVSCEWFMQKKYKMFITTCLITLYMTIVMVGFRIHYTVDIIIGIAMAHYVFMLFTKAAPYLDEGFKRMFNYVWNKLGNEELKQSNRFLEQQQSFSPDIQITKQVSDNENKL